MTDSPDIPPEDSTRPASQISGGQAPTTAPVNGDAAIEAARDEDLGKFNADDVVRVRSYDTLTMAMAASFESPIPGAVGMARAALVATIERHGDFSLSNGGGTLAEYFRERFDGPAAGESEDEEEELLGHYVEAAERRREEREREEWARKEHSYAGVTRTGAEWLELAQKLRKGEPLHNWLVEQMRKDGEKDPEGLADLVRLKTELNGTPERYWTEEQKRADAYLKAHPEVEDKVAKYTARVATYDVGLDSGPQVSADGKKPNDPIANNSSTATSVNAGADLFSSAPDLVKHHQAALAAIEPLDSKPLAPMPEPPPPRPTQVATIAPGSGFDV